MARKTSDARAVSARERARERAAQYRAREARLEELGVSYFSAVDQVERVYALRDKEIAVAEEKASRGSAEALADADQVIREMLELGVPRAEAIERLGCTSADVRRATAVAGQAAPAEDDEPEVEAAEGRMLAEPMVDGSTAEHGTSGAGEAGHSEESRDDAEAARGPDFSMAP
ncbi:hypothetical protein ACPPVW_18540 [Leifsonia sp. McL0607]|uniref:hypothetical protein n=1 Tax=Leifsonia sp. McL0607 TaxID=3415672 RepID=UPI003CEA17A8